MVWDVMVVGHTLHGHITKMQAYQLGGCTTLLTGVNLTVSLLAIIIQLEDSNHVVLKNQPLNAKSNVLLVIQSIIKKIYIMPNKCSH